MDRKRKKKKPFTSNLTSHEGGEEGKKRKAEKLIRSSAREPVELRTNNYSHQSRLDSESTLPKKRRRKAYTTWTMDCMTSEAARKEKNGVREGKNL